ncbi:MAG TPA: phosphatase PAP2 family protein, partial [Stellaceae bacterium]|nr:phosphatase PAP2 family protein [Stellaceae bacterium]
MSVSGPLKQASADRPASRLHWVRANVAWSFALFARKPKFAGAPIWRAPLRLAAGTVAAIAIVAATMIVLDAPAVTAAQRAPAWLPEIFDHITEFGKSVWFLVPIALALATIALLASPALPRMSQRVLAAIAVRLGFLFLAIGLPGLVFTIGKRLIGRARPFVEGSADPLIYRPLGWSVEYASLPSGHAVDAFAAAMAIGVLWPRMRPLMWTYAVVIAVSRVVLTAHFPSDVMVGAVAGAVGALLVRDWYAARGLAFVLGIDGVVRPLPGP